MVEWDLKVKLGIIQQKTWKSAWSRVPNINDEFSIKIMPLTKKEIILLGVLQLFLENHIKICSIF